MKERPEWDQYFLGIAEAVKVRADCRRREVGAVIVNTQNVIVATGYNGVAPGADGCLAGECPRGLVSREEYPSTRNAKFTIPCISTHAESNAIDFCLDRRELVGATIYVTHEPCRLCRIHIIAVGIERSVWPSGSTSYATGYKPRTTKS